MKLRLILPLVAGFIFTVAANAQVHVINTATDIFVPSFRDLTNSDAGNTTYFGWVISGTVGPFDGGANNELMENPAPNAGVGGLDGSIDQDGTQDILAGSNIIYNGTNGRQETLSLTVPTNGSVGMSGFTTIIIQGQTFTGSPAANTIVNYPSFSSINGISPTFVIGLNANGTAPAGQGQWWVKYELPGNQASYDVDIAINNTGGNPVPLTIQSLVVDTKYSTEGYAPDTAAVPEPSTWLMGLAGLGLVCLLKKRRMARN